MTGVVGTPIGSSFTPESRLAGMSFTRIASYIGDSATTWNPTFTDIGSGRYRFSYTPATSGVFEWTGSSSGGDSIDINFTVLPAAADPAAIADAIAGIMDQSSAGYDAGTIGYEIHALFKRPVGSG